MFPAATAAPVPRIVTRRGIFAVFPSAFKFGYVLTRFLTVCHDIRDGPWGEGAVESRSLKGALRFGQSPTTIANTIHFGPTRLDGIPHVCHGPSRPSTDERGHRAAFRTRLCT